MNTIKLWTKFNGKPNSSIRNEGIRVTMGKRGEFYLNKAAWEALGEPEAVELMFDLGRAVIGMQKVDPWVEDTFPVKAKNTSSGRIIRANPFVVHHQIKPPRTVIFNKAHMDEGVLSLPLQAITAVSKGSR
ncbi:MAG: hypothetical protein QM785_06540 [Pyrinomonadaceae bacterium]